MHTNNQAGAWRIHTSPFVFIRVHSWFITLWSSSTMRVS